MYKIAGELTSNVIHVTARALATHALSIFGDQSDVMACRSTGYAMLASNSVQEAADMALIAHISTLEARVPFMHFFDGFRTSHEINKALAISDETIQAMLDEETVLSHRSRALSPDQPHPARDGAEPRRVLPGARGRQSVLPGLPHDRAERDGPLRQADRPGLPSI